MTVTIKAELLERLARNIFVAAGTPADIAAVVAQSLVQTNLMGHDSHGVLRVKQYVTMIREGMIQSGGASAGSEAFRRDGDGDRRLWLRAGWRSIRGGNGG